MQPRPTQREGGINKAPAVAPEFNGIVPNGPCLGTGNRSRREPPNGRQKKMAAATGAAAKFRENIGQPR